MGKQDAAYDHRRYQQLLVEAVDEKKRLALIDLLIEERAKERLEAQRASDRAAMTATTIAKVLGASRADQALLNRPKADRNFAFETLRVDAIATFFINGERLKGAMSFEKIGQKVTLPLKR